LGRLQEAQAAYAAGLSVYRQLAAEYPAQSRFRMGLAQSYNSLGALQNSTGRLQEAEASYSAALDLLKQLTVDLPNQPDARSRRARVSVNIASIRLNQRDYRGAEAYLADAAPHHEWALKANPRNPDYRDAYRKYLIALVQSRAGLGDHMAAQQAAEKLRTLGWDPPGTAFEAACGLALCIPIAQQEERIPKEQRDKQALS